MPEEEEKKGLEVTIISRNEYVVYPKVNQPKEMLAITYQVKNHIPRTIFVAKDEWSKEKEPELIRRDWESYIKGAGETITI